MGTERPRTYRTGPRYGLEICPHIDWPSDWLFATTRKMTTKEKLISATEFRAKCLRILDELEPQGIVITKKGQPVARLMPLHVVDNSRVIASMKDKVVVKGDISS